MAHIWEEMVFMSDKRVYGKRCSLQFLIPAVVFLFCLCLFGRPQLCMAKSVTWTVTQHGEDADRGQSMFYTIKGSNGKLIVIDGGWHGDQYRVRNVIMNNGGTVDLWIITHPHPDHTGAFNRIVASPQGIKIKKICAPRINAKRYNKYKHYWDGYSVYQEFMSVIAGKNNIKWLKAGDSFNFYGLQIDVFNSYSSNVRKTSKDICNGSSLVFKASGKKTSMLFTGDIGASVGRRLIKTYGSELKTTYLQAPHHGNNAGRSSFFKKIGAKITFIDAPGFLRRYPAVVKNMNTIQKTGSKLYTYANRKTVTIK